MAPATTTVNVAEDLRWFTTPNDMQSAREATSLPRNVRAVKFSDIKLERTLAFKAVNFPVPAPTAHPAEDPERMAPISTCAIPEEMASNNVATSLPVSFLDCALRVIMPAIAFPTTPANATLVIVPRGPALPLSVQDTILGVVTCVATDVPTASASDPASRPKMLLGFMLALIADDMSAPVTGMSFTPAIRRP